MTMDELLLEAASQRLLRPLDVQFALMVAQEAHPAVKLAAAVLSRDAGEGHVCLPISRLRTDEFLSGKTNELREQLLAQAGVPDDWSALLLASEAVSGGERPTPIVLCGDRLYLNRMWRNELTVARFFNEANQVVDVDEALLARTLDALFPASDEIDWQKVAAAVALTRRISVISGGPGTGKTTTVARLLAALIQTTRQPRCRIRLAAPTGKAAARLTESLGEALRRLPLTDEQKALLPTEASTLHRLLGAQPGSQRMRYHAGNPLHLDVLVVDEASMIDQILFHHLLKAIPKEASVVFVGDVDQLPSVGPGNVLKDIINSGICPVVHLKEIFRQGEESMIVVNAHKINSGEMPCFDDKSNGTSPCDFYFIEQNDPDKALEIIKELVTLRIPQKFGFDPVKDIQVLTPMHRGSVGTTRLNSELREVLNIQHGSKVQRMGRIVQEGDKVMQIRNNYEKDVYNGDIGTVLRIDGEESKVIVEMDSGRVSYDFSELDELIHAYAVSIHKSQGSEYPAVVIPIMTQHYMMLQRNLLYTGITRGKKLVVLVGTKKAVAIAVKNDKTRKRYTRLAGRLKDCLKG